MNITNSAANSVKSASTTASSTFELVLQNSLDITPDETCISVGRPGLLVLPYKDTSGVSSCEACSSETNQQHKKFPSTSCSLPNTPATTDSTDDSNSMHDCPQQSSTFVLTETEAMDQQLDTMLARWLQLQKTIPNGENPSLDTLSTTLILLQLQKIERRVMHQEQAMLDLQQSAQARHSDIQSELTKIVTSLESLSHAGKNSGHNTPKVNSRSNSKRSGRSLDEHFQQHNKREQQQQSLLQHQNENRFSSSGNCDAGTGIINSIRSLERQPPQPPQRHDSRHTLAASMNSANNSSASSTDMRNPHLVSQPPPAPPNQSHSSANADSVATSQKTSPAAAPGTAAAKGGKRVGNRKNPLGRGPHPLKPKSSFRSLPGPRLEIIWDASEHNISDHTVSQQSAATTPESRRTSDSLLSVPSAPGLLRGSRKDGVPNLASTLDDDAAKSDNDSQGSNEMKLFSGMNNYIHSKPTAAGGTAAFHDSIVTSAFASFGGDSTVTGEDDDDTSVTGSQFGDQDKNSNIDSSGNDSRTPLLENDNKFKKQHKKQIKQAKKLLQKEKKREKKELKMLMKEMKKISKDSEGKERPSSELSTDSVDGDSISKATTINSMGSKDANTSTPIDSTPKSKSPFGIAKNIIWKRTSRKAEEALSENKTRLFTSGSKNSSRGDKNSSSDDRSSIRSDNSQNEGHSSPATLARPGTATVTEAGPSMPQRQLTEKTFDLITMIDDNPRAHSNSSMQSDMHDLKDIQVEPQAELHMSMPYLVPVGTDYSDPMYDSKDIQVEPPVDMPAANIEPIQVDIKFDANGGILAGPSETKAETDVFSDDITTKTPMSAKTPYSAIMPDNLPIEAPPPPEPQRAARQKQHRVMRMPHINSRGRRGHPPSPTPRVRQPFPRTQAMMSKLVSSKRDIMIGAGEESARMQISTLTLDTALPSADAGSVLQEVNNQSLIDRCQERGTYTGTVSEMDEPNGYGTMIYNNGAFYKGQWKQGHWHGEGILRTPDGDSYEGDFVYDCRHGRGIYKYANGDVYEGDFSTDKRHGKGTFLFQNGSMYRGDFSYGNFHGYGWYEFEDGYYEGAWVDGNYEGIGTLTYKDGSHYTGRFKGGVADGIGEERKADGTGRRGTWRNGEYDGDELEHSAGVLSI